MKNYRTLRKIALAHEHRRNGGRPPGQPNFPPEVGARRARELSIRKSKAGLRAKSALAIAYPGVYRRLYLEAVKEVNRERGPLPGDDA